MRNEMILEAARTGNVKDFRRALSGRCCIDAKNADGETALSVVSKVRPDLVRLLVENGADVNAPDGSGITPLHWAATMRRSPDCCCGRALQLRQRILQGKLRFIGRHGRDILNRRSFC